MNPIKVIIAGSRSITDFNTVSTAISESGWMLDIQEVVSGTARGVDQLGEDWAGLNEIPIKRFPADWNRDGKGAGYIRNQKMGEYADALILVYDGISRGARNMLDIMKRLKKPYYVKVVSEKNKTLENFK